MTTIEATTEHKELTEIARAAIWAAWSNAKNEDLIRYRDYADGKRGIPDVPEGSSDEIKELANQSVRNVCGVVVDTFNRGLSVVGFRSPTSADDEPAWEWWQRNRMDARQHEVHDATLTYGMGYVSVLPGMDDKAVAATWTPRHILVEWDNPKLDIFPTSAMLIRDVDHPVYGKGKSVLLVTDTTVFPGFLKTRADGTAFRREDVLSTGDPWEHGATYKGKPVCPVVRFVNEVTAEDRDPRGEVEPLIGPQRAINSVNFDRLCVSRFGAFRQKVVIGWSATADQIAQASAAKTWAFEDENVKVQDLDASPLGPYDAQLREMTEQVALQAGIPLHQLTGSLQNVSTETAALAESAHQRKLKMKRETLGESWEIVIRLGVAMEKGADPSESAEVMWAETEARSFAAVVDGMVKLASVPDGGVPIEQLLDLIPGMTQQRIIAVRDAIIQKRQAIDATSRIEKMVAAARALPGGANADNGASDAVPASQSDIGEPSPT